MAVTGPPAPGDALRSVLDRLDRGQNAALERLFRLLAIPSVSTDPAFHESCVEAAEWCAGALREIGFDARVEPTLGKPMVVGHWRGAPSPSGALTCCSTAITTCSRPTRWTNGRRRHSTRVLVEDPSYGPVIVARGASDDKGQLMTFVEAARAWLEVHGELPVDVSVLIEGEEESGSPSLAPFLAAHGDELRADIALVCDTGTMGRRDARDHRLLARARLLRDHHQRSVARFAFGPVRRTRAQSAARAVGAPGRAA